MKLTGKRFEIHALPDDLRRAGWESLLRRWSNLITYTTAGEEDDEDDVPYWYGERPLTGLLAAAAWRHRQGWSLEEFAGRRDRKSTRLNSSHLVISYAVFCLKKKKKKKAMHIQPSNASDIHDATVHT